MEYGDAQPPCLGGNLVFLGTLAAVRWFQGRGRLPHRTS